MKKFGNLRFYALLVFIFLIAGCIVARLFSLQIIKHGLYTALAEGQHTMLEELVPRRGEIFIQEKGDVWHQLATNRDFQTVFLSPNEVTDKEAVAMGLAPLLEISEEKILEKLKDSEDPYEPLKSKLDDETAKKITDLKLKGVHLITESWRWYPQGSLASGVLGFVGIGEEKKVGQYGLEQYYEDILGGKNGLLESERDALGRGLLMGDYNLEPAQDGASLYLTLDQNIQYMVEQKMKAVIEKWGSTGGCAIVLEPKTGAIRAMVSLPNFDGNDYKNVKDADFFMNACTQKLYEPGSIFKPIVMAAGLDSNKISPETTFVDTGSAQIGGYTINNAQGKTYGLSTMTQVLEKSINTGVIFVQRTIGGELFKKYIEAFGFDESTGIDSSGEAQSDLRSLKEEGREINFATVSFGQGISITPIQMASAIGAIANNGKLMRPYLVEKIVQPDGQERITSPQAIRDVISPSSAGKLTAMLVSTVRNGYDKIKISGYFIAGKTGTAQIASKSGYSANDTNHSFVGYAPAYDPKFLILLKMEKPRGIEFASESLAPVFGDLVQYLFNYYEIPPEE
jgi:cell division protein FtsI (penicillin-binding protein 3)/stage V sporulation protein D (sporulation-specific penicillin-binding protein)